MKILVFGAGPLGSLFAVRLLAAGHDVSLLARGQRLRDLQTHGVILEDSVTGQREVTAVPTVASLEPDDQYDLILVVMRKNQALDILPTLAANKATPTILFMMNNAAGQDELVKALGKERVLIGFPLPGGHRDGHVIRIVPTGKADQWALPIGEVDGRITGRTHQIAEVLRSMPGYSVDIRTDMDAWLKCHVGLVAPALSAAIYAANIDPQRLARTPDALILAVRGLKEAMAALRRAGVPLTPKAFYLIEWLPEPLLVWLIGQLVARPELEASLKGHPLAARDEMVHLTNEFLALVKAAGAKTPVLDQLYPYFDPQTPPLPDGRNQIPMNWRDVWIIGGALASLLALGLYRRWR
jgi:2-dehydropantoate 2-reductase